MRSSFREITRLAIEFDCSTRFECVLCASLTLNTHTATRSLAAASNSAIPTRTAPVDVASPSALERRVVTRVGNSLQ
jgi:hypothetical protein